MLIAKVVSLTALVPLGAMLVAGGISACLTPSREAPKDPAPPAPVEARGSDTGSPLPPPSAGAAETPPTAVAQTTPAAQDSPEERSEPPPSFGSPQSGPQRPLAQCKALWDGMQQKVESFDVSHRKCNGDADCATVPGRVCLGACETAVAKDAVKEREALFSKIGQNECKAFMEGCSRTLPIPVPSCPMYVPFCSGGVCAAKMK
jgi:hypothetical protein